MFIGSSSPGGSAGIPAARHLYLPDKAKPGTETEFLCRRALHAGVELVPREKARLDLKAGHGGKIGRYSRPCGPMQGMGWISGTPHRSKSCSDEGCLFRRAVKSALGDGQVVMDTALVDAIRFCSLPVYCCSRMEKPDRAAGSRSAPAMVNGRV